MEALIRQLETVTDQLRAAADHEEWDRCRELLAVRAGLLAECAALPAPDAAAREALRPRLQELQRQEREIAAILGAAREGLARELERLGRRQQGQQRRKAARYIDRQA